MAMQLDLHKSESRSDYFGTTERPSATSEVRIMTWLVCFEVHTSFANWLGLPPLLSTPSHQNTISERLGLEFVPRICAASSDIQRRMISMITSLENASEFRTRMSLIQVFDNDLDRLAREYDDVWCDLLDIKLQGAKLYLYEFLIAPQDSADDSIFARLEGSSTDLRTISQLAMAAAVRAIQSGSGLFTHITHATASPGGGGGGGGGPSSNTLTLLRTFPEMYLRTLFLATIFLLWFLTSDIQALDSDKELAHNSIGAMYRLFSAFADFPQRLRIARTIEVLGRLPMSISDLDVPSVSTKAGASCVFKMLRKSMIHGPDPRFMGGGSTGLEQGEGGGTVLGEAPGPSSVSSPYIQQQPRVPSQQEQEQQQQLGQRQQGQLRRYYPNGYQEEVAQGMFQVPDVSPFGLDASEAYIGFSNVHDSSEMEEAEPFPPYGGQEYH
ncbi:hypothetical protein MMC25_000604 [Agyrium rufum]|nr:hypothetical protein [Agyrium rufum]